MSPSVLCLQATMLSHTLTFVMQVEMIKADSFHAHHSTVDLKKNETEPEKKFPQPYS